MFAAFRGALGLHHPTLRLHDVFTFASLRGALVAASLLLVLPGSAAAQFDVGIRVDKITSTVRDGTFASQLVVESYRDENNEQVRDSEWKYTVRHASGIAIFDDGDSKTNEIEGDTADPDPAQNCSYYKIQGYGGLGPTGKEPWSRVRCKRLVSAGVDSPGSDGHDVISIAPQGGTPPMLVSAYGGKGNDVMTVGGFVSGTYDGGEGKDRFAVNSYGPPADWAIDLLGGRASSGEGSNLSISGFEDASGGYAERTPGEYFSPNYTVVGTNGPNTIQTVGGNDEVAAGGGDDQIDTSGFFMDGAPADSDDIDAGPGNDDVESGYGADDIDLGTGNDTLQTNGGADTVRADSGNDRVEIGQQALRDSDGDGINDQVAADVTVDAGEGDDTVGPSFFVNNSKPVGRFTIDGGPGRDKITGGPNDDTLSGGEGDDTINAGAGDDTIRGGPGNDIIDCGEGDADVVLDAEPGDTLKNCEGNIVVELIPLDGGPDNDITGVTLKLSNPSDEPITDIVPNGSGIRVVPGVFPPMLTGAVLQVGDSGEGFPTTMQPKQVFTRTYVFLTVSVGRVLLQAEVSGRNSKGKPVRDAEYAELEISPQGDRTSAVLHQMGAIEAYATNAHQELMNASTDFASDQADRMRKRLPTSAERRWLGTKKGAPKVRRADVAVAGLHGLSPEELATEVPRGSVIKKGGERKISAAQRAVLNAGSDRERRQARQQLTKVRNQQTLTSSESMALYNKARMETDRNELYKIYEDYAEKPAKALYNGGGAMFDWLLQAGSYEGRQQIEADLVRFAEYNNQSLGEGFWVWSNPDQAYDLAIGQFKENVEQLEVRRVKRENIKRDYYMTDPEKAIYLAAEDDSWYSAQVLRTFIDALAPNPAAKILDKEISFGGKVAKSSTSRASIMVMEAVESGDKLAGRKLMNGAEDLGTGGVHADDFTFRSADPDDLLRLDQLGKQGGAGARDQRIAEQINREVTDQLRREYPGTELEFNMNYRPKKAYDPVGSLSKPQAFAEKSLDPRSIEVLGAPPEGLGKLVIFKPDHPSGTKGWKNLPAVQKQADLELYEQHLDQWINFNKRNPAGKTADWKPALKKKTLIEFGGGHTVELKLEKKKLGKNAFEIRATEMNIDGSQIYKGKKGVSIGGDLDPLAAINAKTGKKLSGEIERRGLELWNEKAVKAQKELGFRSGGHGATAHGDDVTPQQWAKFAKYAAVHLTPEEQLLFEALVVKRAGLPVGTKILPGGIKANEHLVRTSVSDTWAGPLGTILG